MSKNIKDTMKANKAGLLEEEKANYEEILANNHKDPNANHKIALIFRDQGDIRAALHHFKIALELSPHVSEYWLSYVSCLYENNFSDIAAQVISQARILGFLTREMEDLENNNKRVDKANKGLIKPIPRAYEKRLLALSKNKKYDEAEKFAKKILDTYPQNEFVLKYLGDVYSNCNDHVKAISIGLEILKISPNSYEAYHNLGIHCKALSRYHEAEIYLKKAIEIHPEHLPSYNNLAQVFYINLRYTEAIKVLEIALSKGKNNSNLILLAKIMLELGELEASEKYLIKALEISPNSLSAVYTLGVLYLQSGKFDNAIEYFTRALTIDPLHGDTILAKTRALDGNLSASEISELELLLEDRKTTKETKVRIGFSLALAYETLNQVKLAFNAYLLSNKYLKELSGYKIQDDVDRFERINNTNIKLTSFAPVISDTKLTPIPIFIIGMPRSGTTLIEQVLSAHSCIDAGGELPFALRYGLPVVEGKLPLNHLSIKDFREKYFEGVSLYSSGKKFITDKTPHNFLVYRLIQSAIPESKIIFMERDSAATLWGNFKEPFTTNILKYSNDLDDLVHYWHLFSKLIDSYSLECSKNVFRINYELFTSNPNDQIKRLLTWLDLNIEDSCFSPEDNYRPVKTASLGQIRKKIYRNSSIAWKKYESELSGKFDNLGFSE